MSKQYYLKCTIIIDVFDDECVEEVADVVSRDVAECLGLPVILDDIEENTDEV